MENYYFVSIGGSGAKTLEALTHLCVAGSLPDRGKLNILAIDPDVGNGNLTRCGVTLNNYSVFQDLAVGSDSPLFKTKVNLIKPFPWNPTEHDRTLDDLMGYQIYKKAPIGRLYEVLYTGKERGTILNEGFRGHPSIGAAVLAEKYSMRDENSAQWNDFISKISNDTKSGKKIKIFLAGSVFGGTGAAGIPTIARLLYNSFLDKKDSDKISIGGALILPYFNFTAPDDETALFAKSENFLTNTKAALKYYSQKDNVFNSMYFIGDSVATPVNQFSVGAATQKNDAHIVDFYSALAAIDFFSQQSEKDQHKFKVICHHKENSFSWGDFPKLEEYTDSGNSNFNLNERFVKFARFIFAYVHLIKPVLKDLAAGKLRAYQYPWFVDFLQDVDINSAVVKNFENYAESFVTWLKQIETLPGRGDVSLIKTSMFTDNPAKIVRTDEFKSCDGQETDLTFNEIWYRLSEPLNVDTADNGFGKFLRRLYEACEYRKKKN